MKIFTLNIKGRKQNVAVVKQILTYVNADAVCLVESGDNPSQYIGTAGLAYCVQNSSYVAVLTKAPFTTPVDLINYQNPYPPGWPDDTGMNNKSLGITTTGDGGKPVYIVAAHLDSNNYFTKPLNETLHYGQIGAILATINAKAGSHPVIMAGDFNCASHLDWSWWISPYPPAGHAGDTTDGGAPWQATREVMAAGFLDAGKTGFKQVITGDLPKSTWIPLGYTPVGYQHERIDIIYYRGCTNPTGFDTLDQTNTPGVTTWPTDHRGVVVSLTLP